MLTSRQIPAGVREQVSAAVLDLVQSGVGPEKDRNETKETKLTLIGE